MSLCNQLYALSVVPNICALISEGKIEYDAVQNPSYFKGLATNLLGRKAENIVKNLKVEKVTTPILQGASLTLITPPSLGKAGEAQHIAIVYKDSVASSYTLEFSVKNLKMICSNSNGIHLNFGTASDKKDFVLQVIKLVNQNEEIPPTKEHPAGIYDELDLKHRLANEIGVRYEMLDFYMKKFQDKVCLEMSGIDTSGIDDDIEDVDEWLRYCNWEIEQSMKRLSSDELAQSKEIFDYMIQKTGNNTYNEHDNKQEF